jgi:hypothetical protein
VTKKKAKGITSQEFNEILGELLQKLQERRQEAGLEPTDCWFICFDQATAHTMAHEVLEGRAMIWHQAAHSPDTNKPIEHVHAQLDSHMHKWLRSQRTQHAGTPITVAACMQELQRAFAALPTSSIAADVATLTETWQAIVDNEGGYVAGRFS